MNLNGVGCELFKINVKKNVERKIKKKKSKIKISRKKI